LLDVPTTALTVSLIVLLALSAFFSGTETALMSANRDRLRHFAREGSRGARAAARVLERPDRLVGLIVICNNVVNTVAVSIVTLLCFEIGGGPAVAIGVVVFAAVLIIFGELAPKTVGGLYPERLAIASAPVYEVMLKILQPVVWTTHLLADVVLRLLGVRDRTHPGSLAQDELRTVVAESSTVIPNRHQRMLMSLLDLERMNVEDIMVPRTEIAGLDLTDDWDDLLAQLRDSRHTRIPVYEGGLDQLIGILHMKKVARLLVRGELNREQLRALARAREPYYVPEGTTLNEQLLQFQRQRRRLAFVVDEYGDVLGLVTLEDLLEELVGEIYNERDVETFDAAKKEADGVWLVQGNLDVRAFTRISGIELDEPDEARSMGGLVVHLAGGSLPDKGATFAAGNGTTLEATEVSVRRVRMVRVRRSPPAQ
jgi:Mg2+/Co2+ transporter CorB